MEYNRIINILTGNMFTEGTMRKCNDDDKFGKIKGK